MFKKFDYNVYQMTHSKKISFSNSYSALDPLSHLQEIHSVVANR